MRGVVRRNLERAVLARRDRRATPMSNKPTDFIVAHRSKGRSCSRAVCARGRIHATPARHYAPGLASAASMKHDVTIPALDGLPLRATLFEDEPRPARGGDCERRNRRAPRLLRRLRHVPRRLRCRGRHLRLPRIGEAARATSSQRRADARLGRARRTGRDRVDARALSRACRLHLVGHSYGGHALLLAPNNHEVSRAVTIASFLGYWGNCAVPRQLPRSTR